MPCKIEGIYIISVAARLTEVHPRTLRIYEAEGFITPCRTEGNIRLYCEGDLEKVRYIRFLTQQKGVNLAGVKIILELQKRLEQLED
ncbi:MAG: MerR family transcriptional regulator [Clostridia bacterium]|jgi:MerR family transcriptional regulator/heat shock protein HspR|nr:MerR family transcriptional regulator [Clostridia bacterium]